MDEDAKGPPIDGKVIAHPLHDDLGSHVLNGTTDGVCGARVIKGNLGEAKVSEDDITILTQEDVLRLEVTVDDAKGVEMLEGQDDLGGDEDSDLLIEHPLPGQVSKELAPWDVLEDQVQLPLSLEGVVEFNDEGVLNGLEDLTFSLCMLRVFGVNDDSSLFQGLHGKETTRGALTNKKDLSVRPCPNNLEGDKVFWSNGMI